MRHRYSRSDVVGFSPPGLGHTEPFVQFPKRTSSLRIPSATPRKLLFAAIVICVSVVYFWHRGVYDTWSDILSDAKPSTLAHRDWAYDWERDRDDYGLSNRQCDIAFPDLYYEVDRSVQFWSNQTITPDLIELPHLQKGKEPVRGLRLRVVKGQLYVVQSEGWFFAGEIRRRLTATLLQINRALTGAASEGELYDDMEFTVIIDDVPMYPEDRKMAWWGFTRGLKDDKFDTQWIVPDFNLWALPPVAGPFAHMQALARARDNPITQKIPKAVWRGVVWTHRALRETLLRIAKNQDWADVEEMGWHPEDGDRVNHKLAPEEFCDYAYLIHTEGIAYSSRLNYILNCDSVPVLHELHWTGYYYHLLEPNITHIPVKRSFADLPEKILYYRDHTAEAQKIADKARSLFRERYLTPAAEACYWRKVLLGWSQVAFKVSEVSNPDPAIFLQEFITHDNNQDYPWKS